MGRTLPQWIWKQLRTPLDRRRVLRSPDRVLLVEEMLPVFAGLGGRVLWVGVRRYTRDYPARLSADGAECWTVDIAPKTARWGARGRHVIADLTAVDGVFPAQAFDAVLCNGVFGFGLDDPAPQAKAFAAMATVMRPGAWLLLGWNTDRTTDPLAAEAWRESFETLPLGDLPARRAVAGTTHVYDILRRR